MRGHLHLVTQVQRELEDIFVGLGYRVVSELPRNSAGKVLKTALRERDAVPGEAPR